MNNNQTVKFHSEKIKKPQKIVDKIIYFAAILMPLMTIPQIISVWVYKTTTGVSLLTWGLFTLFSMIWLWYAIVHKNKPLLINNILWILMQGSVFIGVLVY